MVFVFRRYLLGVVGIEFFFCFLGVFSFMGKIYGFVMIEMLYNCLVVNRINKFNL